MPNSIGVSNAIGGTLKKGSSNKENEVSGEWSFEYNQTNRTVLLNVDIKDSEANLMGETRSYSSGHDFTSKLDKNDINQIIQWFYAVKSNMA